MWKIADWCTIHIAWNGQIFIFYIFILGMQLENDSEDDDDGDDDDLPRIKVAKVPKVRLIIL